MHQKIVVEEWVLLICSGDFFGVGSLQSLSLWPEEKDFCCLWIMGRFVDESMGNPAICKVRTILLGLRIFSTWQMYLYWDEVA